MPNDPIAVLMTIRDDAAATGDDEAFYACQAGIKALRLTATPEHDAKVRDAVLEEAAKVCENGAAEAANHRVEFACDILSDRIRDLKSTGTNHDN